MKHGLIDLATNGQPIINIIELAGESVDFRRR